MPGGAGDDQPVLPVVDRPRRQAHIGRKRLLRREREGAILKPQILRNFGYDIYEVRYVSDGYF